ncbi:MAG TPA: hypothetical protein VII95_02395 [Terriglobales bacterium]
MNQNESKRKSPGDELQTSWGADETWGAYLTSSRANEAWGDFLKSDFATAISNADRCIQKFKAEADREEEALQKKHVPPPPTGKVTDDQKNEIYAQGVLNDVAACYWIKGMSAQKLRRNDEARDAFKAASAYTHGRTWDPKGWFWSPAQDASVRLRELK